MACLWLIWPIFSNLHAALSESDFLTFCRPCAFDMPCFKFFVVTFCLIHRIYWYVMFLLAHILFFTYFICLRVCESWSVSGCFFNIFFWLGVLSCTVFCSFLWITFCLLPHFSTIVFFYSLLAYSCPKLSSDIKTFLSIVVLDWTTEYRRVSRS